MSDAVDRAADELYGVPLDEFIARRDALARELRSAGDRDAADRVKRLPKPSVPAWAINRLARERPDEVAALMESGENLRNVQEWLLRREADPTDLREAVESERAAVGRLVNDAAELLTQAGRAPRGDVLERVAETLHATASDPEVRSDVERGTLVQDRAAVGLGPTVAAGATRRAAGGRKRREPGAEPDEAPAPSKQATSKRATAKRPAAAKPSAAPPKAPAAAPKPSAAAREELRAAQSQAKAAERAQASAERAVERAARALDQAEASWSRAQDTLRDARDELAAARKEAGRARDDADAAAAEVERRRRRAG